MCSMRFLSVLMTLPIISGLKSGEMDTSLNEQAASPISTQESTIQSSPHRSNNPHSFYLQHFSAYEQSAPLFNGNLNLMRNETTFLARVESDKKSDLNDEHTLQKNELQQDLSSLQSPDAQATAQSPELSGVSEIISEVIQEKSQQEIVKEIQELNDLENDQITLELIMFIEEAEMIALEQSLKDIPNSIEVLFAAPVSFNATTNSFQTTPISLLGNWYIHENSTLPTYLSENSIVQSTTVVEQVAISSAFLVEIPQDTSAPIENVPASIQQSNPIPSQIMESQSSIAVSQFQDTPIENTPLPRKQQDPKPAQIARSQPTIAASQFQATSIENTPLPKRTQKTKPAKNSTDDSKERPPQNHPELFLFEVGAVYLKPYQGGTDFAETVKASDFVPTGQVPYGTNKPLDFDFDWGFRAGIGYQAANSRQSLTASYLYLSTHAQRSINFAFPTTKPTPPPTPGFVTPTVDPQINPINFSQAILAPGFELGGKTTGEFFNAFSNWDLHFNMLDILFSKKVSQKGCMSFEPFIGIKGLAIWEIQTINLAKENATVHLKQKNSLKGVGAIAGFNLDWIITNWLSLLGTIDGALLVSKIETNRTSDNGIPSLLWTGTSNDYKGTPVIDGMLALRGVYCWKSGRFIDLKIGFEEHYVFDTMKHYILNSDSSTDLSLMGWFATIGVGF